MDVETALKLGIQYIGNKKYKDATTILQDALNSFEKEEIIEEEKKAEDGLKYTEEELYALNKEQQKMMLRSLGVEGIPRFESGRVKKILELQG